MFALVDITEKNYASPHAWGRGYELCEFAFSFDTFAVLHRLLGGSWSGHAIAIVGVNAMDEEDDAKRGPAPTNAEIDAEYRVLETRDLRVIEGLESLRGLAVGERIDRATLPDRVIFYNQSDEKFFAVDTKDVDEFTVAALVWFLVDTSSAEADDIVDVSFLNETGEVWANATDDDLLKHHGGTWAYDSITAIDDDDNGYSDFRDATEDLRAVAAAFRRRNDPEKPENPGAPPKKRQRTIAITPRDDAAPEAATTTALERIRALCDDFTEKLRSRDFPVDRLFEIVHSAQRLDGYAGDLTYVTGGEFRFLSAALLMALEQFLRDVGGVDRISRNLRVVECVLSAFASPRYDHERSTGTFEAFGERAVVFAKHCRVPFSTYERVRAAFDVDQAAAYRLDLKYARLEQAGCVLVPGDLPSLRGLFPLPGSSEERDGDHLKTLVDTHRSLGNAKRVRRV